MRVRMRLPYGIISKRRFPVSRASAILNAPITVSIIFMESKCLSPCHAALTLYPSLYPSGPGRSNIYGSYTFAPKFHGLQEFPQHHQSETIYTHITWIWPQKYLNESYNHFCIITVPSSHCTMTILYYISRPLFDYKYTLPFHHHIDIQWQIKEPSHIWQWTGIKLISYMHFKTLEPWQSSG